MLGREACCVPRPPRRSRWKALVRPGTLGLLALSLSVFLWGYGYKLSLYQPHRSPQARASVAKLWVESKSSGALHVPARPYAIGAAHADEASTGHAALQDLGRTALPLTPRSRGTILETLLPSRAPPASSFSGPAQA